MGGFKSKDGRVEIDTGVEIFECSLLEPQNSEQRQMQVDKGPRYRIITSLNMLTRAAKRKQELMDQHSNKCFVEILMAKREGKVLADGDFKVYIDGEEVTSLVDELKARE